jgi:hypothetical protein
MLRAVDLLEKTKELSSGSRATSLWLGYSWLFMVAKTKTCKISLLSRSTPHLPRIIKSTNKKATEYGRTPDASRESSIATAFGVRAFSAAFPCSRRFVSTVLLHPYPAIHQIHAVLFA